MLEFTANDASGLYYQLKGGVFIIREANSEPIAQFNQFPNPDHFDSKVAFSYVMN